MERIHMHSIKRYFILLPELFILLYLLFKVFTASNTNIVFEANAFFDNARNYDFIEHDDRSIRFNKNSGQKDIDVYTYEFALPSGAYDVAAEYASADSKSYIQFRSQIKESTSLFEDLYLDDVHNTVHGRLYIPIFSSVDDFQLYIHYDGPGELTLYRVTLTPRPVYRLMQFIGTLIFFFVIDAILFILFYKEGEELSEKVLYNKRLIVLSGTLIFSCLPLFAPFLYYGHDLLFHLNRIDAIATAMREHMIPIRIQREMLNSFGYESPLFYCDIFLYPVAFLYEYGYLPMRLSYQIYVLLINALTLYTSFRCMKVISKDEDMALTGCVLYTLCIYRIETVYLRAALGEYTAMAFLPLVVEGVYRIYSEKENQISDWMPLAFGMTGLLQCHIPTLEMCTIYLAGFVLVMIRKMTFGRFFSFVKAAIVAVLMGAWFLIPMLDSIFSLHPILLDKSFRIQHTGAYITQIFALFPGGGTGAGADTYGDMPLGIGGGLIAVFFIALFYQMKRKTERSADIGEEPRFHVMTISFAIALLAIWMSTCYFPIDTISRALIGRADFIVSLLESIETLYRYLSIASIMLTVTAVSVLPLIRKRNRKSFRIIMIVIVILLMITDTDFYTNFITNIRGLRAINQSNEDRMFVSSADYDLELFMFEQAKDPSVITQGDIDCVYSRTEAGYKLYCKNMSGDGYVILPLFDFGNYHAYDTDTGEELRLDTASDQHMRVRIAIPEGFDGDILIRYAPPVYWHIADYVSLTIVFLMIVILAYNTYRNKRALKKAETEGISIVD